MMQLWGHMPARSDRRNDGICCLLCAPPEDEDGSGGLISGIAVHLLVSLSTDPCRVGALFFASGSCSVCH